MDPTSPNLTDPATAGPTYTETEKSLFPQEPVQAILAPIVRFLHVESASGLLLLACSGLALLLANLPVGEAYLAFWKIPVGLSVGGFELEYSLQHWINDGLMVIFFFVIGLEVKRELVLGELRDLRRAALPLTAAIGGMLLPAGIFLALQAGEEAQRGWGIPMATDIAFVVGCMAVLGSRVPSSLRIMLLSLAIIDDLGAILVIAIGYSEQLQWSWLAAGAIGIGVVLLLQRLGVRSIVVYTLSGIAIWLCFHESGVHATIAGVILGLMTPARPYLRGTVAAELLERATKLVRGGGWASLPQRAAKVGRFRYATLETISPLEHLEYLLHPWVAFVIMPLFALANAGVPIYASDITSGVTIAVLLGLAVGKPVGILLFSWLAIALRIAELPTGVGWRHLTAGGMLTGIGFTMALFIAGLALDDPLLRAAKLGVLIGSVISAVSGMLLFLLAATKTESAPSSTVEVAGSKSRA